MALQHNDFAAPDEIRRFGHGRMEVVNLDAGTVGKGTFEPGWRWSEHVAPIAGTAACQIGHLGYVIAGRMRVVMDDGSSLEVRPGEVFEMPPGHDAWTVGDEPCVLVDFAGAARYAVPQQLETGQGYQLLSQRTIPDFEPQPGSYALAVEVFEQIRARFAAPGLSDPAQSDPWTAVVAGLAAQQTADDPGGDRWAAPDR